MASGFIGFEITWRADVFADAPQSSSAASFDTLGINFRARKPRDEQERAAALTGSHAEACLVMPDHARGASPDGKARGES